LTMLCDVHRKHFGFRGGPLHAGFAGNLLQDA
jgi:hypothetical protein